MSSDVKILLVEDHPLVREGLKAVLSGEEGLTLVGTTDAGGEVEGIVEELRPDVVVMDIGLPDADGIAVTRSLKRTHPELVILVVTVQVSESRVREALEAGAHGYLSKTAPSGLLPKAIRCAVEGGVIVSQALVDDLLHEPESALAGSSGLSPRELEVLSLISAGYANKQISAELNLAESTVKKYVYTLMSKMGASDRAHAAALGLKLGMIR